jgi:site-specific recombinase XerD
MSKNTMHYLKPAQLRMLLDVAAKHTKRDVCMIVLSFRHGLRASEVCSVLLEDVNEANSTLCVRAKKTRTKKADKYYETLSAKDDFAQADLTLIHQYLKERENFANAAESPVLFLSRMGGALHPHAWGNRFSLLAHEAGLTGDFDNPHILRHVAAMYAIKSGASLPTVSRVLRHRSIASLTPYISASEEDAGPARVKAFSKINWE